MPSAQTPQEIMSALIEGRKPTRRSESVYLGEFQGVPAIYSYGPHFPMALGESSVGYWVNEGKYSHTTSMHQCGVKYALQAAGYKPTDETKQLYQDYPFRFWIR